MNEIICSIKLFAEPEMAANLLKNVMETFRGLGYGGFNPSSSSLRRTRRVWFNSPTILVGSGYKFYFDTPLLCGGVVFILNNEVFELFEGIENFKECHQ